MALQMISITFSFSTEGEENFPQLFLSPIIPETCSEEMHGLENKEETVERMD